MTTFDRLSEYGLPFQLKVLACILTDKPFLVQIRDMLKIDYFDSDAHKWIITKVISYFDNYHATISLDVLKIELNKEKNEVLKTSVLQHLRQAYEISDRDDLTYVKEEFHKFCTNQNVKAALLESVDLLKQGAYEDIVHKLENSLRNSKKVDIGHQYEKDIESRYREDARGTLIPTPWPDVNKYIKGGMGAGDLVILAGNPGGGKSSVMVQMAVHAIKSGFNVVYYTLELGEGYVGQKFDSTFLTLNSEEILKNRALLEKALKECPGKLVIKEFAPRTATISTIKSHLKHCSLYDFKPDLIIIDYLDYLKGHTRKEAERKGEIDDVYIGAKGLAKELQIPIASPSQVGRKGAKEDVIEGDNIAGSYDKIMIGDIVWSVSRKKEDKVNKTGRVHWIKNRYGPDGMTFGAYIDIERGDIRIEEDMHIPDIEPVKPTKIKGLDNYDLKDLNRVFTLMNGQSSI